MPDGGEFNAVIERAASAAACDQAATVYGLSRGALAAEGEGGIARVHEPNRHLRRRIIPSAIEVSLLPRRASAGGGRRVATAATREK